MFTKYLLVAALFALAECQQWNEWKQTHGKSYNTRAAENKARATFNANKATVESHNNNPNREYDMELNEHADLTFEEFTAKRLGAKLTGTPAGDMPQVPLPPNEDLMVGAPLSFDWRPYGVVLPVENQGNCGCCYAFATMGAFEGQLKRRKGISVPLSKQAVVDCSTPQGNAGCNGGNMNRTYVYVSSAYGIPAAAAYPYVGVQQACKNTKVMTRYGNVTGYYFPPANNEGMLVEYIYQVGPHAMYFTVTNNFQLYKSGIFTDSTCGSLGYVNHAMLIVGYGTDGVNNWWIVKNSWGTGWGESGYVRVRRGVNMCKIALQPSCPALL